VVEAATSLKIKPCISNLMEYYSDKSLPPSMLPNLTFQPLLAKLKEKCKKTQASWEN
jgi:hypothetical protein